MKHYLYIFIGCLICQSCKKESLETTLTVSLKDLSMAPSVVVSFQPCTLYIKKCRIRNNKLLQETAATLYTDSFGRLATSINLTKPVNKEYYIIEAEESKWQTGSKTPVTITAGIGNTVTLQVTTKYSHIVRLQDVSGKYQPTDFVCTNTLTRTFVQSMHFENFKQYSDTLFTVSAPLYTYLFSQLSLKDRSNNTHKTISEKYDSENNSFIWIKF